jgi:Cd2+/Zn2+-exporting ATPase
MSGHPRGRAEGEHARWRLEATSTVTCLAATLAGWALPHLGVPAAALPALALAYVAGGWDSLRRAVGALRSGRFDVDLLMLLAAAGAAVVGHWLEGAILLFLFSLGNTLETYAFGRTRRSIGALMELRPDRAALVENGVERTVPLEDLRPGDVVRVRPGERIPVDGAVVEGASEIDESTLTGEPTPVAKALEDPVFAGTLNGGGSLDVRMTRAADDTTLARIIRLVEQARESRAPTQSWIERVESRYAALVIAAAVFAVLLPWLAFGWTFDDAFYRAMTLLVVASPCALVISIPATIVSAVSNGARHGILFKGGAHVDALTGTRVFALDKTGTLTVGRPELVAVRSLQGSVVAGGAGPWSAESNGEEDEDAVLRLVAGAEARSEHHLGQAVLRAAVQRGVSLLEASQFRAVAGHGVEAVVDGRRVHVGRRAWIEGVVGTPAPRHLVSLFEGAYASATPVYVALDGQHAAALAIADQPRDGTAEVLAELRAMGIERVVMLTGDSRRTAESIAAEAGIDEVHAELLPHQKSLVLAQLRAAHGPVAMVGDGVNDAPALAAADIGIAIGAAGTDVALETADVVVMGDDLRSLAYAVRLSRRTRRIVRQNLGFALSVMAGLVTLALLGTIGLTAGVIGHEGSTIVVAFNGLRLLRDG